MKRSILMTASVAALGAAILAVGPIAANLAGPRASAQIATAQAASERTVTFTVQNMTCALCPVTVKTAMERVNGVRSVAVDFAAKTATVVFDPSLTTPEAIGAASTNAGYPASPAG